MPGKLRSPSQENKIRTKNNPAKECCYPQYPVFSFRNLTKNAGHNFGYFSTGKDRELTLVSLFNRLKEISEQSWLYWSEPRKGAGYETIPYEAIEFKAADESKLSKDSTIIVFRFDTYQGSGKGRILGYKDSPCSVMQIIGFDFNFSAYKH